VYAVPETPGDRAAGVRGVQHQPREQQGNGAEPDRGEPGDDELAEHHDVPRHRLGDQVDDRPVVDLRAQHRRGGEQRDDRQGQGEPDLADDVVADAGLGQRAHHDREHDQQTGDQHQHQAAAASQQGLVGEPQDGRVQDAHRPTR
jgi:hypothetical protein